MSRSCSPSESVSPWRCRGHISWEHPQKPQGSTHVSQCCQHRLLPERALAAHEAPSLAQPRAGWPQGGRALLPAPHAWSLTWLVAALLPSPFQARKLKKVLTP